MVVGPLFSHRRGWCLTGLFYLIVRGAPAALLNAIPRHLWEAFDGWQGLSMAVRLAISGSWHCADRCGPMCVSMALFGFDGSPCLSRQGRGHYSFKQSRFFGGAELLPAFAAVDQWLAWRIGITQAVEIASDLSEKPISTILFFFDLRFFTRTGKTGTHFAWEW